MTIRDMLTSANSKIILREKSSEYEGAYTEVYKGSEWDLPDTIAETEVKTMWGHPECPCMYIMAEVDINDLTPYLVYYYWIA